MTINPRFNLGDEVWIAIAETTQVWHTCPDCCGERALTLILGTGERVSIACETCKRGYEPSSGQVYDYEHQGYVEKGQVAGVELRRGKPGIEYRVSSGERYHVLSIDKVFHDKKSAQIKAEEDAAEHNAKVADRINQKSNPHKTWAWHVAYHRMEIRRCEKDLAYHRAALDVAKVRAKRKEEPT